MRWLDDRQERVPRAAPVQTKRSASWGRASTQKTRPRRYETPPATAAGYDAKEPADLLGLYLTRTPMFVPHEARGKARKYISGPAFAQSKARRVGRAGILQLARIMRFKDTAAFATGRHVRRRCGHASFYFISRSRGFWLKDSEPFPLRSTLFPSTSRIRVNLRSGV